MESMDGTGRAWKLTSTLDARADFSSFAFCASRVRGFSAHDTGRILCQEALGGREFGSGQGCESRYSHGWKGNVGLPEAFARFVLVGEQRCGNCIAAPAPLCRASTSTPWECFAGEC
jgi:hypothetical protein